jgi:hypothetical protein
MRFVVLCLLLLPIISQAQVNRSARQLASETIPDYVTTKLFKGQPYKAVSFGELKSYDEKKTGVSWALEHSFEITESKQEGYKSTPGDSKQYKFLFYLDKKMKVIRAESFYSN